MDFKGLGVRLGAALAAGCVLAAAGEAAAGQKVFVTYEGVVTNSFIDTNGVFGAGAGVGSRYVSEYVFDIGEGFHNTSAVFDYVFGGSAFGRTSPGVSGKLTINGNSVSFTGGYVGQHGYWVGQYSHSVIDDIVGGVWSGMSDVLYFDAPKDLGTSFAATGTGGTGSFHICNWWEGVGCAAEIPALQGITSADRVSVRVGGAVPEPGTWALAILGFGLAGAALRRSRTLAIRA